MPRQEDLGAETPWYLQYCEIAAGLQILLAV